MQGTLFCSRHAVCVENRLGERMDAHPEPAPRYEVVIKEPKKPSKPSG